MSKSNRKTSGLLKSSKEKNKRTLLKTKKILKKMLEEKQKITFSSVAKQAQVSRSWLYNHDKIRQKIEAIRVRQNETGGVDLGKTEIGSKSTINHLKERNQKLEKENRELKEQIEIIYGKMLANKTD